MTSPDTASVEDLSLVGEVRRLQADNAALRAGVEAQRAMVTALRTEHQALRDEVAMLLYACMARITPKRLAQQT